MGDRGAPQNAAAVGVQGSCRGEGGQTCPRAPAQTPAPHSSDGARAAPDRGRHPLRRASTGAVAPGTVPGATTPRPAAGRRQEKFPRRARGDPTTPHAPPRWAAIGRAAYRSPLGTKGVAKWMLFFSPPFFFPFPSTSFLSLPPPPLHSPPPLPPTTSSVHSRRARRSAAAAVAAAPPRSAPPREAARVGARSRPAPAMA